MEIIISQALALPLSVPPLSTSLFLPRQQPLVSGLNGSTEGPVGSLELTSCLDIITTSQYTGNRIPGIKQKHLPCNKKII